MTDEERRETIAHWEEKAINVIVATDAFGLGVDLLISRVILYGLPANVENLWQKIGRAGRDGSLASGCLYWSWEDVKDLGWMTINLEAEKVNRAAGKYQSLLK